MIDESIDGYLGVVDLVDFLNSQKEGWTEMDEQFLGNFEDQGIAVWTPEGYVKKVKIQYDAGCGFLIIPYNYQTDSYS